MPNDQTLSLGKSPENDIVLDQPGVSRQHAWLHLKADGSQVLEDRDSTNGTFVNDRQIRRQRLEKGDRIRLGPAVLDLEKALYAWHRKAGKGKRKPKPPSKPPASGEPRTTPHFEALKAAYEAFEGGKLQVNAKYGARATVMKASVMWIPFLGNSLFQVMWHAQNKRKQLELHDLQQTFARAYVCPQCHTPLGHVDPEVLLRRKACRCGDPWVVEP